MPNNNRTKLIRIRIRKNYQYHNNSLYETRNYSIGPPPLTCSETYGVSEMYSIIAD